MCLFNQPKMRSAQESNTNPLRSHKAQNSAVCATTGILLRPGSYLCRSRSVITYPVLSLLKHPQLSPPALAAEHKETELKTQTDHTPLHHKHWAEEPRLPHFVRTLSYIREHLSKIQATLNTESLIIYRRNEAFK